MLLRFLCQLIVFYRNTGYLPEQPSAVYQKITLLMLEDWDQKRRGVRNGVRNQSPSGRLLSLILTCVVIKSPIRCGQGTLAKEDTLPKHTEGRTAFPQLSPFPSPGSTGVFLSRFSAGG